MSPRDVPPAMLRIPPQSAEAEASLLGGLLLSAEALEVCGGIVSADDFYSLENRLVFEAVMALAGAGKPADVVTVFDWLQSAGKAADVGGIVYLNSLAQYVPSGHNMRRYAEIVRERAQTQLIEPIVRNRARCTAVGVGCHLDHAHRDQSVHLLAHL